MFYKKNEKFPQNESLEINIKDFSKGLNFNLEENVLEPFYAVNNYNFAYKKGVLTESYGFKTLSCPNYENDEFKEVYNYFEPVNFKTIWFFKIYDELFGGRVDKIYYYGENGVMYFSRAVTTEPLILDCRGATLPECPDFSCNIKKDGVDFNLIGGETMGVYSSDGNMPPVLLTNCPKISTMCEDKDKFFAAARGQRNIIYYFNTSNFNLWSEIPDDYNGQIEMNDDRGKINKVISFLGYVYAIRDYGITKIFNHNGLNKFDITHLSLSGTMIYGKTVEICSDKVLMLTKDGIASFNGVTLKTLNLQVNEMLKGVNNDNALSVYHSGKYYLACRLNFNDEKQVGSEQVEGFKNNALIILDVETMKYDILRGVDIASMISIKINKMDKVALILNSLEKTKIIELCSSGAFYDSPLKKEWVSPLTDLGYSDKIKFVKDFSLLSKYDCKITIFTEKESKVFNVKGRKTLNRFKVNLKGKQIGIKIESETTKAYISNVKLNIDLLNYEFTKF